ncbi:DUF1256 domain-containing protein [Peribacillus sp. FSL E2-0218]|uniref:DUF1256 domain-containing protein n=1 Tax=Peribacillus sp. FSL E2-0218 TaxID=2921364 RepID=UPI0030EC4E48
MYPFNGRKKRKPKEEIHDCTPYILERDGEAEVPEMSSRIAGINQSHPQEMVFLCIGSDRSTGDSFGPLVGTMLKEKQVPYHVFGTLSEPVHALNLKNTLNEKKNTIY